MVDKMVVYGDLLFIENFIIGTVILYITGEIMAVRFDGYIRKVRLILGGVLCGAFSFVIFLSVSMPVMIVMEAAFAVLVYLQTFGKGKVWAGTAVFILVTYFFGGVTMGLLFLAKAPGIYTAAGIYTGDMKAGYLAAFIGLAMITARQIIKTVTAGKFFGEHVVDVVISIAGTVFEAKGFIDTGNQLKDPVSGKPAAIAQESLWKRLNEAGVLIPERMGVIPYETVGAKGIMASVRTDYIKAGNRYLRGNIVAKSDGKFGIEGKAAEDCELLLSRYMIGRKV